MSSDFLIFAVYQIHKLVTDTVRFALSVGCCCDNSVWCSVNNNRASKITVSFIFRHCFFVFNFFGCHIIFCVHKFPFRLSTFTSEFLFVIWVNISYYCVLIFYGIIWQKRLQPITATSTKMPLSSSLFGTATSQPTPECIIWRLCLNSPKTALQSALPATVIRQGGFSNALPLSCLIINHPDLCKIPLIFIPQTVHNFTQRLSRFHSLTVFRISEQSLDYGTAESFVQWKNSLSAQIVHNRSVRSLISNRILSRLVLRNRTHGRIQSFLCRFFGWPLTSKTYPSKSPWIVAIFLIGSNFLQSPCTLFNIKSGTFPTCPPKSHTRANTAFPCRFFCCLLKTFHVNFPVLLSKIIHTNNHTVSVPFLTRHTISFNYPKQTFNLIKLFFNSSRLILRKNNHTAEKREGGSAMTHGLSKTKAVRFFFSAVIFQEKIPYPNSFLSVLNI